MKKFLSFVLALALVLTATAAFARGEDFELHNGTTFGMSVEEICEVESDIDFSRSSNYQGGATLDGYATVAGYPNTRIIYEFSAVDGTCNFLQYSFKDINDPESFDLLESVLTQLYGETEYTSDNGKEYPVFGKRNTFTAPYTTSGNYERLEHSHRFFQLESGAYVFIEHYRTSGAVHSIIYRVLDDAQADQLLTFEMQNDPARRMDALLMDL